MKNEAKGRPAEGQNTLHESRTRLPNALNLKEGRAKTQGPWRTDENAVSRSEKCLVATTPVNTHTVTAKRVSTRVRVCALTDDHSHKPTKLNKTFPLRTDLPSTENSKVSTLIQIKRSRRVQQRGVFMDIPPKPTSRQNHRLERRKA